MEFGEIVATVRRIVREQNDPDVKWRVTADRKRVYVAVGKNFPARDQYVEHYHDWTKVELRSLTTETVIGAVRHLLAGFKHYEQPEVICQTPTPNQ